MGQSSSDMQQKSQIKQLRLAEQGMLGALTISEKKLTAVGTVIYSATNKQSVGDNCDIQNTEEREFLDAMKDINELEQILKSNGSGDSISAKSDPPTPFHVEINENKSSD